MVETTDAVPRPNMPLAGVTVIDLTQIYQGPYATLLMAKAGADVIKIEPVHGEPSRMRAKVGRGASLSMVMLNTNKRGITLNLKSARGRDLLKEMVKRADILIENFAPGVLDKLGVGWSVLHEINPRLIYGSGTGYGLSGPDRGNLAMDLTVQATSGIMSITGEPDGSPMRAGPSVVDFLSGTHLFGAIMAALYERTFTNTGRLVEVAMQDVVYPTLASNLGFCYNSQGRVPPRVGNRHGGLALAPYNVYAAKDGHIAMVCVKEDHWKGLTQAMGQPELQTDPRFGTNANRVQNLAETDAVVQAWAVQLTRAEIFERAGANRVPCAPVRDLVEVMHDPHMHERGMLEWFDDEDLGRVVLPNSPLVFHGADRVPITPSPHLGEDNNAFYAEWFGYSEQQIEDLKRDGVI